VDPEDLREVISAYQESVAETIRRFGGFVAQYMGDGALVSEVLAEENATGNDVRSLGRRLL
jgi:class 3 adenylate cyclase